MQKSSHNGPGHELPPSAQRFLQQVTRSMRYRRRVRRGVEAELVSHFEDALRGCEGPQERERKARDLIDSFGDPRLLGVLCRRAKKRCRPLWRRVLVRSVQVVGIVALYLAVCSAPLFLGEPVIRVNYVEWLNRRWQPDATGAANAKEFYDEAAETYVPPPAILETKQAYGSAFSRSAVEWLSGYNAEEKQALEAWLRENQPAFDLLREGAETDDYWPVYEADGPMPVDLALASQMQQMAAYRQVVLAFREQIAWKASLGRTEEALVDCLVLQAMGRHLQGKGSLADQLVGISIESLCYDSIAIILKRSDLPTSALARLQEQLETRFNLHRRVVNLDSEKAIWYDQIQRHFTDDGHGGGHALKGGLPFAAGDLGENVLRTLLFDYPDRREATAMVECYFDRAAQKLATMPRRAELGNRVDEGGSPTENLLLALVSPAHDRVIRQAWRLKTHEAARLTLVPLQRYALDHGRYPAALDRLVERRYLRELPADPFGEGPLTYRRTDEGFLLYSWGANLEDDGGRGVRTPEATETAGPKAATGSSGP